MSKHQDFVHLHLHTQYSLLDGAIRHEDLMARAKELGMTAVAATDHGNLFGAVEFYQKAMGHGIKPIIGCEVYVASGKLTDRTPPSRALGEGSNHLVLLVKNMKGYHNLCKLLTKAYLDGFYYKPRVDKDLLREHNEGLIALSACLKGEVAGAVYSNQMDKAALAARQYSEIFTNRRFFIELQENGIAEQRRVNKGLMEVAKTVGLPLVATNDCHYLRREDARAHEMLLCIQTGKTMSDPARMKFETDEFYFKSREEMIKAFKDVPEAVENTVEIAGRCNLEFKFGEYHLPEFPLSKGDTVESCLDRKALEGLEKRFPAIALSLGAGAGEEADEGGWKYQYYERLKKELNVVKKMGFPGYFLIVNDVIEYAKSRKIPVGPGRGSAAGSLVAYALGITNLDPIRYNLLFERFLNPDRISLPDIDMDFCIEGREEVIRHVTERYGADRVSQIITFGQMKARAVIRDVGRVMDMPYADVDRIAKLVPNVLNITIDDALKTEPKLKELVVADAKVKELITVAKALEGLPRHASTHAAGVVISRDPLVEHLPLYKGQKDNIVVTQFSMKDVEKIGLVKFDFLGIKTLTLIDRAVKAVEKKTGAPLDIDSIPLDDKPTFRLFSSGATNGIFQFESSGMKELLRRLAPETFEDLIAAVALYRPGPLDSGMTNDFVKRKQGLTPIAYEVPELKGILDNTYGVMVYQEQVMEISKVLAGFTPGDADVLRKAMGKKVPEVMLEQRTKFLDGAREKKIPPKKAERIFDHMAAFAGYGFNKSHSAAYAMVAYQTAYLKARHPVEFMAALLTANMGDMDKIINYISECRETGIKILPPDLNESSMDFTVVGDRAIRFGLAAVKNVGEAAIESVIAARDEGGAFASLDDFLSRIDSRKANKKVIESLIKCGAFDFTGVKRDSLMGSLDFSMDAAQGAQRDRAVGQKSIFDIVGGSSPRQAANVQAAPESKWSEKELLAYEKESLGFYITSHPLAGYKKEMRLYASDSTETLADKRTGEEAAVAGMVADLRETVTKKGNKMAFIRLEDLSGSVEAVIFSDLYESASALLKGDEPVVLVGRVERESASARQGGADFSVQAEGAVAEAEVVKIIATDVMSFDEARKKRPKKLHILTPTDAVADTTFAEIKSLLKSHSGASQVFLHLLYPDTREVVIGLPEELKADPTDELIEKIRAAAGGAEIKFS